MMRQPRRAERRTLGRRHVHHRLLDAAVGLEQHARHGVVLDRHELGDVLGLHREEAAKDGSRELLYRLLGSGPLARVSVPRRSHHFDRALCGVGGEGNGVGDGFGEL